jgi:hypothetical protein
MSKNIAIADQHAFDQLKNKDSRKRFDAEEFQLFAFDKAAQIVKNLQTRVSDSNSNGTTTATITNDDNNDNNNNNREKKKGKDRK